MYEEITAQARQAVLELLEVANLKAGDIFVVGCSSSEMVGQRIGKGSSLEAAQAAFDGIYPVLQERGIYLAAQCCEHLNRSLIVEEAAADKYDLDVVNVQPWEHAGGSFATTAFARFEHPVAVTHVRAKAGIDIGGTLIGKMCIRDRLWRAPDGRHGAHRRPRRGRRAHESRSLRRHRHHHHA